MHDSKPKGCHAQTSGFTLVELIASVSILGAGILALAHISLDATALSQEVRESELASLAINQQIQLLEATPYFDLQATHDGRGFSANDAAAELTLQAIPGDPDNLPGLIAITAPDPPNDPGNLLAATITLNWLGKRGVRTMQRTVQISAVGAVR